VDLWEATALFRQHLGPDSAQPMPRSAHVYLCLMRARIAEELAFLPGSSLYERLLEGGGGSYDKGERCCLVALRLQLPSYAAK